MPAIPEKYLDLTHKKAFAQLATLMPDGSPHVAPVWFDYDGTHILIAGLGLRQIQGLDWKDGPNRTNLERMGLTMILHFAMSIFVSFAGATNLQVQTDR